MLLLNASFIAPFPAFVVIELDSRNNANQIGPIFSFVHLMASAEILFTVI
jgi:hypothetical protein